MSYAPGPLVSEEQYRRYTRPSGAVINCLSMPGQSDALGAAVLLPVGVDANIGVEVVEVRMASSSVGN